jgi:ribosomal protein S18 acetylase RimI-like enzyme
MMTPPASLFSTQELSSETWSDFAKLFAKHGGVQAGCWCMFYHRAGPLRPAAESRLNWANRNRSDKRALVRGGSSHGILVYAGNQPVGSCQYGLKQELPRIDAGRNYRKLELANDPGQLWRITCFFVDRDFRRQGIATLALRAALEAIQKKGGGVVEAYPVTNPRAVPIWFGSVEMFEREGFQKTAQLGRSTLVMRRSL